MVTATEKEMAQFWARVEKTDECWIFTGCRTLDGYGFFRLNGHNTFAHRISFADAYGPIPKGKVVCHHCDNTSCVRPDHLFAASQAENIRDKVQKGRQARGMAIKSSKLTDQAVREIRSLHAHGITAKVIAIRYSVRTLAINRIIKGQTWRHV